MAKSETATLLRKVLVEAVHDTINRALDAQAAHTEHLAEHSVAPPALSRFTRRFRIP